MSATAFSASTRRWILLATLSCLILLLAWWLWPSGASSQKAPGQRWAGMQSTPTVVVAKSRTADIPVLHSALGTVEANRTVTVTSRVEGELLAIHFKEGGPVEKGQLLADIDPRPYQAAYDQAVANLAQNQALLKNARQELARAKTLVEQRSLARQELEAQQASVGQYEGAVKAAEAQKVTAELNLGFTKIRSPISGYAGLRLVDPGNMVSANSSDIVTITQTTPANITFSLPARIIPQVLPVLRAGDTLPVWALSPLDGSELAQGKLAFISNQINVDTGSIGFKASFANEDERLYPNQAVRVRIQTGTLKNAVVVPAHAVQLSDKGEFVWLVNADNSVNKRMITTGDSDGDDIVVTQGLDAGMTIVTQGVDRLKDGQTVKLGRADATDKLPNDNSRDDMGLQ